jgi:hypothetical protein
MELYKNSKLIGSLICGTAIAVWLGHQHTTTPTPVAPKCSFTHNNPAPHLPVRISPNNVNTFISSHWHIPLADSEHIVRAVLHYGHQRHIDPALIFGIIATESSFDINAYSDKGAVGLMQGYPTAHWKYVTSHHLVGPNYHRLFNIQQNIEFGTHVLNQYMRYKTPALILSHYFGIAQFDSTYVHRVMYNVHIFDQILSKTKSKSITT